MGLEIKPERLLIAAEVGPSGIIDGHVRLSANKVRLGLIAVKQEHLGDLCIDSVRGVVSNCQILGVEELADAEVSTCRGQDVDGLNGRGVVGRPLNVNLYGQLGCGLNHTSDWIEPVHMPGKDGRSLSIQPKIVW